VRCLCLTLLLMATGSIAFAQTPISANDASGLEITKFSWSKERIGWENDPFRGPIENFDEMRARARNEKRIADAKRGGGGSADKIKIEAQADAANIATQHKTTTSRYVFTYKATVRNLSNKTITLLDWDYVFFDKGTDSELGRHQFTNEEKIGPGKSRELLVSLRKPPTQTISVTSLNKNEGESLIGRIMIIRVQYSDGTSWQALETTSQQTDDKPPKNQ
jgi:hypothetical protein